MNRLQKFPYSPKGFKAKQSKKFFLCKHIFFFSNSLRDVYSENNNVSKVYTYIHTKNTKKKM
jgi:hypothetical protein